MKTIIDSNKKTAIVTFVFFALILGGCVSGKQKLIDQGNKPLTNMELIELFAVKQITNVTSSEGNSSVVTYLPDGTISAVGSNGKTYPGTFSIEGDKYCSKMAFRGGAIKCTTWFKVDDKIYKLFNDDGSSDATVTFQ